MSHSARAVRSACKGWDAIPSGILTCQNHTIGSGQGDDEKMYVDGLDTVTATGKWSLVQQLFLVSSG